MVSCAFKDCRYDALPNTDKCEVHKFRKQCRIPNCFNIVYARHLCVRHGGKKKCKATGCAANAYGGNFCGQHGGSLSKPACKFQGCTKQSHTRGLCVTHGGGRRCQVEGCGHYARGGGHCHKHKTDQQSMVAMLIKDEQPLNSRFEPITEADYHYSGRYDAAFKDDLTHHEFLDLLLQYFPPAMGTTTTTPNGQEPWKMTPASCIPVRSPCSVDALAFNPSAMHV
ncbi:Aste57867_10002 [Aphanomyces stellatus]|uniref:Aste57867_10002 protein n=1 Tax=Aphanomyces stellatus TaxID=120398 RepID=A0A485KPK7_9STRA|nr:hypothetical protein As57867_009963 [Aphanomyces stellatus]VFT86880.1 Aste57867_10002 [Aphanomyces stellatus]